MKVKRESEVAQSCPTLSDPMDCSPPGSSVHGIFQARVLEWGAIALSGSWAEAGAGPVILPLYVAGQGWGTRLCASPRFSNLNVHTNQKDLI